MGSKYNDLDWGSWQRKVLRGFLLVRKTRLRRRASQTRNKSQKAGDLEKNLVLRDLEEGERFDIVLT